MAIRLQSLPDRRIDAVYGAALLLFLQLFATLGFHIGMVKGAFIGVPVIAILLWPRRADAILSILFISLSGLLMDGYYGLPMGGSSFLYLWVYALARPKNITTETEFLMHWRRCVAVMAVIFCGLIVLSWRTLGYNLAMTLFVQSAMVVAIFPLIYAIRRGVRLFFIEAERR